MQDESFGWLLWTRWNAFELDLGCRSWGNIIGNKGLPHHWQYLDPLDNLGFRCNVVGNEEEDLEQVRETRWYLQGSYDNLLIEKEYCILKDIDADCGTVPNFCNCDLISAGHWICHQRLRASEWPPPAYEKEMDSTLTVGASLKWGASGRGFVTPLLWVL